jgi:hypothetical protein
VVVFPPGTALHWEGLDVDFTVSRLLAGIFGTHPWMTTRGGPGRCVMSEAKAKSSEHPFLCSLFFASLEPLFEERHSG